MNVRLERALNQPFTKLSLVPDIHYVFSDLSGYTYRVEGLTCTCPDYKKGFICKHIYFTLVTVRDAGSCAWCSETAPCLYVCPQCQTVQHTLCYVDKEGQCYGCLQRELVDFPPGLDHLILSWL